MEYYITSVPFVKIYDEWMITRGVPYEKWAEDKEKIANARGLNPKSVLDLGCGTGLSLFPWARKGLECYGVERSVEMLNVAKENVAKSNYKIELLNQDIRNLDFDKKVDIVTSCFNTIEHILTEEDLLKVFKNTYEVLNTPGAFMFDINRKEWIESIVNIVKADELSEGVVTIELKYLDKNGKFEYLMTFTDKNGKHESTVEERNYSPEKLKELLEKVGFKDIKFHDDPGLGEVNGKTRSIQVEAWKV
jgi:ubiquinone/menaquinone biosynthesis C-methylase UbiE